MLAVLTGCSGRVPLSEGDWTATFEAIPAGPVNDCLSGTSDMVGPLTYTGAHTFTWELQYVPSTGHAPFDCDSDASSFSCCSDDGDLLRCLDGYGTVDAAAGTFTYISFGPCTSVGSFRALLD